MVSNLFPYFNGTSVQELFQHSNTLTGQWAGPFIVTGLYFVSFITLKNFYPSEKCFMSSGFTTLLLAYLLWVAGVVSDTMLLYSGIFFLGPAIYFFIWGGE